MPPSLKNAVLISLLLVASSGVAMGQIQRITSPDTTLGNYFGGSVDLDDGRLLIGASGEHACGENAGAAYVFESTVDGRYELVARLAPENCKTGRFFGHHVSLSGDRALVAGTKGFLGDTEPNPVYVFERDQDGAWTEAAQLLPEENDDALGFGASIDIEGSRAIVTTVGDPGAGFASSAFIFERGDDGSWTQVQQLIRSGAFGAGAKLDGDRLAVASASIAMSSDGGIYIFERATSGSWEEIGRIGGISETLIRFDLDGDRLVVGRPATEPRQRGRADVYELQPDGRWSLSQSLLPISSYDYGAFGTDVALSESRLLIVGYTEQINLPYNIDRVVYVFNQSDGDWRQQHIIDVGNTGFGVSIDLDGQTALIGEAADGEIGAAYIVRLF